jgi:hypothetical protein
MEDSVRISAVLAIAAGAALWACNSPTDPQRDLAREVVIISGDNQTVPRGGTIPQSIVIEVRDERGRPVRLNPVYWTVDHKTEGRIGHVIEALAETDRHGRAAGRNQVDTNPGEYFVNIWAGRYANAAGDTVEVSGMARVFAN